MIDPHIKQSLASLRTHAPSTQAADRALHRATIALANPAPDAPPARRHGWSRTLMALGSAGVLAFCGWLVLHGSIDQPSASDRALLAQTGQLFPGRLNAIIIGADTTELNLSDMASPPPPDDQAVLIELTRHGHTFRILSYSGRSVRVELDGIDLNFVPLLTATGDILLSGDNFIWSKDSPSQVAGWNVTTQTLAARL
jgi:hypothetical protein